MKTEKLPPKSYHCIHTEDATAQGIYRGFETTKPQFIRIGEMGNKLRNKEHPLMNFATNSFGRQTLTQPNYKKDLDGHGDLVVEDISLFFYGNSNLKMMGVPTFMHHLQGGLLNRCMLIYNSNIRSFDERPHNYELPYQFTVEMNDRVKNLIGFAKKYQGTAKPEIPRTDTYIAFDKYVYDRSHEIQNTGLQDLYKRTIQNFHAIIITLHYLICAEEGQWHSTIAESTVNKGVNYMQYIISGYDVLMNELIGAAQEERDESITGKIIAKIKELSTVGRDRIRHRDIYRSLHLNRADYDDLLKSMNYKMDKHYLYVLQVTV